MNLKNKFTHGDTVYLLTDPDQQPRIITMLTVYPGGAILYTTALNGEDTDHWEFELSEDIDMVKKTSN